MPACRGNISHSGLSGVGEGMVLTRAESHETFCLHGGWAWRGKIGIMRVNNWGSSTITSLIQAKVVQNIYSIVACGPSPGRARGKVVLSAHAQKLTPMITMLTLLNTSGHPLCNPRGTLHEYRYSDCPTGQSCMVTPYRRTATQDAMCRFETWLNLRVLALTNAIPLP